MMTFSDGTFFQYCLLTLYLSGLVMFALLWFVPVPYGRLFRLGWGPSIPPSLAWFLFESPSVWLTLLLFPLGQYATNPKSWILIAPYLIHYLNRVCIYPLRLRTESAQKVPIAVVASGLFFNFLNAYLQTREVSHYYGAYDNDGWFWWRISVGLGLFLWGMQINIWADRVLTGLKGKDGKYRIPKGGWFELVSCPNYFGELLEWFGWTIMTGSLVTLGFFFTSCANLIPRAHSSHKWYLEKFRNYPKTRKALIPYVY